MSAIRSFIGCILFFIFQGLATLTFVLMAFGTVFRKPVNRFPFLYLWPRWMLWAARVLCGITYQVVGRENIPDPSQPHLILSKHSSTWEVFAVPLVMGVPLCYVAKRELLMIPIFGWGFRLIKPITIDRKAGSQALQQILVQGKERVKEGFWIIIFPEGTRVPAGQFGKFKPGGARLATELQLPVVPIAHNAGYFWPRGVFGKRAGTITISIGKPISSAGKDPKDLMKEVETWVVAETQRLTPGQMTEDRGQKTEDR